MLIAAHVVEVLVMAGVPLALGALLRRRAGVPWAVFGAGMLAFIGAELCAILGGTGLAYLCESGALPLPGDDAMPFFTAVTGGLIAALFHEPARLYVLTRYLAARRSFADGLMLGAGHGGCEALLTGVMVLLTLLAALGLREASGEELESLGLSRRAAIGVGLKVYAFWQATPLGSVLGTARVLIGIVFHLAASSLVLAGLRAGAAGRAVAAAVLLHWAFAAVAAYGGVYLGDWGAFGALAATLVPSAALLMWARKRVQSPG